MSGVYVYGSHATREDIEAAAQRLTFFSDLEKVIVYNSSKFSYAWVSCDDPLLFGPAHDPATGVRVITSGRISWDEPEWQRAESLRNYEGGLSNRLVLDNYLRHGISAVERHNGPAALIIWDPRTDALHLFSDHFGYHPIYVYRPDDLFKLIIATHPDAVAKDSRAIVSPDYTSMAEFLMAWRTTPPHTFYREIKYVGAATHWQWDLANNTHSKRTYWEPFKDARFVDFSAAAEELATALRHAIRIRTLPRLSPTVCFVSGGMDSRNVIFNSADPSQTIGLNLYDAPNQESVIAQKICEHAGVRYVGFARDSDYYPRWMREGVKLSGGMWSLEDNHFLGVRELVAQLGARTVITACTADWLLKGYGLEKSYERFLGRNLPIRKFTSSRVDGFLPNHSLTSPPEYAVNIKQRLEEWFHGTPRTLVNDDDYLAVEDKRIRPTCYAVSVSGQSMYRGFPYDTFLADRGIADCYSRTPAKWKLNADLFAAAVAKVCESGRDIVDANFGWRVGSSKSQKLATFARGWIARKLKPHQVDRANGLATDGSWPNLGWYVTHSSTIRYVWETTSIEDRRLLTELWGSDPWERKLEDWAGTPNDLFRLLTLLNHWSSLRDAVV